VAESLRPIGGAARIDGAKRNDAIRMRLVGGQSGFGCLQVRGGFRRYERQDNRTLNLMAVHEPEQAVHRQLPAPMKRAKVSMDIDEANLTARFLRLRRMGCSDGRSASKHGGDKGAAGKGVI